MKNILATIIVTVIFSISLTAQTNSNVYATRYKQHELQLLQQSGINLTSAQADSVAAINYDVWQQIRALRSQPSANFSDGMKTIETYRMQRLTSALQSQSLTQQVVDYFTTLRLKQEQKNRQDSSLYKSNN